MVKNVFFWNTSKNLHLNTTQRTKLIQKWILYVCTKFVQNWLWNARQKFKMAASKFSFFVISTTDRGDFPRIIVIALLNLVSILKPLVDCLWTPFRNYGPTVLSFFNPRKLNSYRLSNLMWTLSYFQVCFTGQPELMTKYNVR